MLYILQNKNNLEECLISITNRYEIQFKVNYKLRIFVLKKHGT